MKIPLSKNEIIIILAIILFIEAIIYLFTPSKSDFGLLMSYSLIIGFFTLLSGWIIGKDKKNGVIDFLKILLPASVSILGTIWLFSSGYLNLVRENLVVEKRNLEIIQDSLSLKEEELFEKMEEILMKDKKIKSYEESVDEIKKESKEKGEAIIILQKINKEYDKQLKKRIANTNRPIIELEYYHPSHWSGMKYSGVTYDAHVIVDFYDKNLNPISFKDLKIVASHKIGIQRNVIYPIISNSRIASIPYNLWSFTLEKINDPTYSKEISLPYATIKCKIILPDY
jgi:hypothetical protein